MNHIEQDISVQHLEEVTPVGPRDVRIEPINPDDPRWMQFLLDRPLATVFHHPAWISVLSSAYGYTPQCLAVLSEDAIVGLLPLMEVRSWMTGARAVCLPFSDCCGPVLASENLIDPLISHCMEMMKERRLNYLEIRSTITHPGFGPSAAFKSHEITLSGGFEEVMRSVGRSHIQHIAKAERDGVLVSRSTEMDALREFIRLNAVTRKKHGVPPQPDGFFHALHRQLIEPGLGFVCLARYADRTIAASLFLCLNGTIVHKYSSSDEDYLDHSPNHLIVREAIHWACDKGFWRYSFGRTDCENEGLRRYKRKWGAAEKDLLYCVAPPPDGRGGAGWTRSVARRLKPMLKKMPMGVLKQIGKRLYAHME